MNNKMPVVFTGHGYPMNAVIDNPARSGWKHAGEQIGKPEAIIAITGHWQTSGLCIRCSDDNPQLFDVWDLPEEIYDLHYKPPGSDKHIRMVKELLEGNIYDDNTWGIDHALWTPLSSMYPSADIPVILLSTDIDVLPSQAYELGKKLAPLRREGVLILGSGNIVHEVDMVDHEVKGGLPWAEEFNKKIRELTLSRKISELLDYKNIPHHELAVPTPDHYYPFLTVLGASDSRDRISVFNDYCERASLSMTSFVFG